MEMASLNQSNDAKPREPSGSRVLTSVMRGAIVVVVVVVYWVFIAPMIAPWIGPKPDAHAGVGRRLTYLDLRPLTGKGTPTSLPEIEKRVTLLNFWGTWCRPCRAELPHIAELRQRFAGNKDFQLLAVSCPAGGGPFDAKSLEEETASLLKRLGLSIPTYYDPDEGTQTALDRLIVLEGYPTTVLLDRHGVIRAVWVGYRSGVETEMERYISQILEESR
jgi:thiol-disulfide isomerase/thioredoxin